MTREELIKCLTLLKEQARNSGANTFVWDISIDSFNFVIDVAIKALEQEPTTKNDLGVDLISRADAIQVMQDKAKKLTNEDTINGLCGAVAILFELPSVTTQEPQTFKWCTDCKEYDQEKHCCHRWSKVIRDTVEELKQEQEPFINKPCVSSGVCEHDKNEVLDKIRAEIEPKCDRINSLASVLPYTAHREIQELLCEIMDLCKAETEV